MEVGDDQLREVADTSRYLVFRLSSQDFAVDVTLVKEVIHYAGVTEVPNTFSYVRGVMSLRGVVIPVVDFMDYIGLTAASVDGNTRILIVHYNEMLIGIIAGSIEGVIAIPSCRFRSVPEFIEKEYLKFYKAAFEYNNRLVLLIESGLQPHEQNV